MSANHGFGVKPPLGQELAVVFRGEEGLAAYPARVIYQNTRHDVAIARVEQWPDTSPLAIAPTDNIPMNSNVLTVEYSSVRGGVQLDDGRIAMDVTATFHKGYIMRDYTARFGHANGLACIDLSYPALKGASGAPVVEEPSGLVLGMIIGNIENQLMPAQVERTERPDGNEGRSSSLFPSFSPSH